MFVKHYAPNYKLVPTNCHNSYKFLQLFSEFAQKLIIPNQQTKLQGSGSLIKISYWQDQHGEWPVEWQNNPKAICPCNFFEAGGNKKEVWSGATTVNVIQTFLKICSLINYTGNSDPDQPRLSASLSAYRINTFTRLHRCTDWSDPLQF